MEQRGSYRSLSLAQIALRLLLSQYLSDRVSVRFSPGIGRLNLEMHFLAGVTDWIGVIGAELLSSSSVSENVFLLLGAGLQENA